MSKKIFDDKYWWQHVNPSWLFSGEPRTWIYAGSTPEEPDFHLMSFFEYYCSRHEATHHRRVKGYTAQDLVDALNSLPPEACDRVTFLYRPHKRSGLYDRGYHMPQIDELGDYWPNRAGHGTQIKVPSEVSYL